MTKAIFLDIDGTLVSFKTHRVPESTIEALKLVKSKGVKIFIATGRAKSMINNIGEIESLGLIDGYITMNGSYCVIGDEVVYQSSVPRDEMAVIVDYCKKTKVSCVIVKEHSQSICQTSQLFEDIFYDDLHVERMPEESFEEATKDEVFQVTPFITVEQEQEIIHKIPNCEIGRWFPAFADIGAKGNTKSKGIDVFVKHFGFKLEETMAFGDGGNDINMLIHAGVGVAMGNARDEVKNVANYVTDSVDECGIANALKHFNVI